jgi:hypothetical protein
VQIKKTASGVSFFGIFMMACIMEKVQAGMLT